MPFGYIPETVRNARGLVIPNEKEDKIGDELILIPRWEGANNTLKRSTSITIADAALGIKTEVSAIGPLASDYRYYFDGLAKEDMTDLAHLLTMQNILVKELEGIGELKTNCIGLKMLSKMRIIQI